MIWIGDLNFRIDDLTGDEINDKINATANSKKTDRFDELLAKDQVKIIVLTLILLSINFCAFI